MDYVRELGLLALGSRLRRISDRIMASGQQIYSLSEMDFEPGWFPLYNYLASEGAQTVSESARALGLTHAAVSQTAKAMAKRGITSSHKDSEDERRRLIELSDQGRELLPGLQDIWQDIERSVQDAVDYGGMDILAALEGLEQALTIQSLSERAAEHRAIRMMGKVEILDFKPEYREYFKDLNVEWLEKYFVVEPIDRDVLWNPESIIDEGGAILFARVNQKIVGTCAIKKYGDEWELTKMAVTEEFQGLKIGKKLMLATLDRARAMNLRKLMLITNSSLTTAVTMYRKMGFRVTSSGQHPKYQRGDLSMEITL